MEKRILLLTDSLGCPRDEINVSDTWSDRIMAKWSGKNVYFYTYCKYGLVTKDIDLYYIKKLDPDLIIMQAGIVDASRRALSKKELYIVERIPVISKLVNKFCNRYHYAVTKIRNIHYSLLEDFEGTIASLKSETNAQIVHIRICGGGILIKKVYDIKKDIDTYNNAVRSIPGVESINPYYGDEEEYLLPDGHHLNLKGQEMVFQAVDKVIRDMVGKK